MEEAARRVTRHDHRTAVAAAVAERALGHVEPEAAPPPLLVRAVAGEAVVGEDRADLAVEVDCAVRRAPGVLRPGGSRP